MNTRLRRHNYRIDPILDNFVNNEVLPLTDLDKDSFWDNFIELIDELTPINQQLCLTRERMQSQIDEWHKTHQGHHFTAEAYKSFLKEIGYLVKSSDDFTIETRYVDEEIAAIAGPQLVVPLKNERFALNAANARWGSLYDALYGTDVIPQCAGLTINKGNTGKYNSARGSRVIRYAKDFLDENFTLQEGSHHDVTAYLIYYENLLAMFSDGRTTGLKNHRQFVASNGSKSQPTAIVLKNNGLHIEIVIERNGKIGSQDLAGIDDIIIESALTTIMDCEDSVSAVDVEDKVHIYRNWLGLMRGDLQSTFIKSGKKVQRRLNNDKRLTSKEGLAYQLHGRSLLLIRNVGLHMNSGMILDEQGNNTPEGIIDAVITSLIGLIDLRRKNEIRNSRTGSIYIVKPKLHGPDEVDFTCELFNRVEDMLAIDRNTIKLGIMDEERRTSVNLKECIRAAKDRVAFINTGFLDRTGDEIHTSMQAGAFKTKAALKQQAWFSAYENNNVDIGLACGFKDKAQIGKGMWAMPDEMSQMMTEKISHPFAGANTAWVPSPTAATLHAMHYHKVNVKTIQQKLSQRKPASVDEMLTIPLLNEVEKLSTDAIEMELKNNIQSILGYVVHWINAGTGCSKIADINNIGLMEDRATLRIASQHVANWLEHGLCSTSQVEGIMKEMATIVDKQNSGNELYQPLLSDISRNGATDKQQSLAFKAAKALIFNGIAQVNGYTEAILHYYRSQVKHHSYTADTLTDATPSQASLNI